MMHLTRIQAKLDVVLQGDIGNPAQSESVVNKQRAS